MSITPKKWRPSLGMVVVAMLIFILCLPVTGIWAFRFYDSQLVRETEQELIVQAAFIEALVINELDDKDPSPLLLGNKIQSSSNKEKEEKFLRAKLDLTTNEVLPPRSDVKTAVKLPDALFLEIGRKLDPILAKSQQITLAGFRILDPNGTIIAGRSQVGRSLAHVSEVKEALSGNYASVIRQRISSNPNPPIYTISRGTGIRVFIAMPIIYQNQIAGVAYLSRTPSHFLRELYGQRWKIALAAFSMLLITFIIAYVFIRTIKGPIEALNERTSRISQGDRSALEPLSHNGTRELANLSEGLLSMSGKLRDRSDYINTFATHVSHELKSPLTSIQGAAELLRDSNDDMNDAERVKFIGNILGDTERLTKLLDRLRDLAEADNSDHKGVCNLNASLKSQAKRWSPLKINSEVSENQQINLTCENVDIILSNLFLNAEQHGATVVHVSAKENKTELSIIIHDNGQGISELNQDKIFQLFFTTQRETGGTGMGLGIIQSILKSNDGVISYQPTKKGTCFKITLPIA